MMSWFQELLKYLRDSLIWWVTIAPWEAGVRVTLGKKMVEMTPGVWLAVPFIHRIFVQSTRLRVTQAAMQTLTSKDGVTISLRISFGFEISNIVDLYNSLDHPDMTLSNIAMSEAADIVAGNNSKILTPGYIQKAIIDKLNGTKYGLKFEDVRVINYAIVRTYRLIGDGGTYVEGSFDMNRVPQK